MGCWLGGLATEEGHFGFGGFRGDGGSEFGIAIGALRPDVANEVGDGVIGESVAERGSEIVALVGEEAGVKLAIGGEAGPMAEGAEGLGYGRDHPDFRALVVAEAAGDFAWVEWWEWGEGGDFAEAFDDFVGGDDLVRLPAVGVSDVHVFDEAEDEFWLAEAFRHLFDGVIIDATADDHIDFDGGEA